MNSETRDSDRDQFFGRCVQDYADAMSALATFQDRAAELCKGALRKRANELISVNGEQPAAIEAYHEPEKPSAQRQFRCGAWAKSRGNNGPNVACWLLWSHQPNEEGFRHGLEVCIWLRNRERVKELYRKVQIANGSSTWEIDSHPLGGPTFRRYPGALTTASVDADLSQLLLDMYDLLKDIAGIGMLLEPGVVLPPRLKAIYKVLEDGQQHQLTDMLAQLPEYLPPNVSIDMTSLKKLMKRLTAKGRENGLWACTLGDGTAQMTLPAGGKP